jgi:hypothetical protein
MIKEIKTMQEVINRERYCDVCGVGLGLHAYRYKCHYCKKDLCSKCVEWEESMAGDYNTHWCKTCWEIGNEYRPKIEEMENQIEKLYEEWEAKCKEEV